MKSQPRRSAAARQIEIEDAQAPVQDFKPNPLIDIAKPVLVIAILAGIAYLGFSFYQGKGTAQRSSATGNLLFATQFDDPERYRIVENDYSDTKAGLLAAALRADSDLSQAIDSLYISREKETEDLLESATKTYRRVIERASGDSFLAVRCRYGLAQALETSGELDEAIKEYRAVAKDPVASEALANIARDRADNLEKPEAKAFYDWFAKAQPATPPPGPGSLAPPSVDNLPDAPDMKVSDLPKVPEAPKPETTAPEATEKPGSEPPKDLPENMPPEKPADKPEEKPADKPEEKPADKPEEKPADKPEEKPAEEPK